MRTYTYKDKTLTFIGSAHISAESVREVQEALEQVDADAVMIELDQQRMNALMHPDRLRNQDLSDIIRKHQTALFFVNQLLSAYQKKMATEMNTEVGGEMKAAIIGARAKNLPLKPIDRPIQTTFARLMAKLSLWEKLRILTDLFIPEKEDPISEEKLNQLKQQDVLDAALQSMGMKLPAIREVIVDERNRYMAQMIRTSSATHPLIIVGAAHLEGIIEQLDQPQDLNELNRIPAKKHTGRWLAGILVALFVVMIVAIGFRNPGLALYKTWIWFLSVSVAAALGALLSGAHPQTILISFATALIGAIHPVLAVGWFAGLSEARKRKPKVKDFETLSSDASSLKGWRHNRVLHVLLVMLMTNLFSSITTFIFGLDLIQSLL